MPREQKSIVDLLSNLSSTKRPDHKWIVTQEILVLPSTEMEEMNTHEVS